MSMMTQVSPKTPIPAASLTTRSPLLQRKCACGGTPGADGECAACKATRLEVQRQATGAGNPSGVPPIVHDVLRSPGQPLDAGTRAFMGQKFGHDFSRVRVHTDARAAESAMAVRASAYTVGERVVFGANAYDPGSHQGRRLLAHELTHVVQQQGPVGANPTVVSNDLGAEREADEAANRIDYPVDAESSQVNSTVSPAGIHRFAPSPGSPLTPGQIAELEALVEEFTALVSSGGVAAEEAAAVEVVVAEAEAAIVAAGEVAAAGTALIAAGETATVGAGALAADDVTGIGVADDVAIPFVLLGAAAMFGLGYLVGNSAAEIAAAWTKAADAVARAVKLIQQVVRRARPQPQTQTKTETKPKQSGQPQPTTDPLPPLRPDTDSDEDRRRVCDEGPTAQRGGNSCHDAFATAISGVTREYGILTPEGLYADFDALGQDRVLYEVKTGYRFVLNTSQSTYRMRDETVRRWVDQSQAQLAVANRCGYPLVWVFNDRAVATFANGFIQPHVTAQPFPCDEDR